ncbi:MAG: hypothetical protein BWY41_00065 [Candidatus Atribacteria bacterium ADurb.Bin276]|uniref:Uncharacterized protein n=1 Tax=Candidatus Atribacter allofermentans TaxID=1852833 RepID=A0A1V5T5S0_9BACT|nr:MAG: hypothetical protein BWY41_00065 [Candidatus Atribacteria bacterium ADurb.Bin276]
MDLFCIDKKNNHLILCLEDKELCEQCDQIGSQELMEQIKDRVAQLDSSQFVSVIDKFKKEIC